MNETIAARRVAVADLRAFIARALAAAGLRDADAEIVAELMADADLQGSDGHGVFRLPHYVRRIRAGGINLKPDIRIARERGASALVDGDNAIGHLVMKRAAEIAIAKAASQGVAWVGAFNSNHAGPASLYALMPAKHGMIGLYLAVGNANHLPPWGGTEMLLSTNPIAIAVPADTSPPILLDMATTVAAYGKVKTAAQRGETMPEGWMIDRQGQPLTDPKRADEGFLLPIGGPKGYGLALMFGFLAGTLNGAAFGRSTVDFNADDATPTNTGQAVMAIDIAAFCDPADFRAEVERVRADIKASPTLPGFDEVRLPGERTARIRQERSRAGIPIHAQLEAALRKVADELGVVAL